MQNITNKPIYHLFYHNFPWLMEGNYDPQKEVGYPGIRKLRLAVYNSRGQITHPAWGYYTSCQKKHAENTLPANLRHISGKQTPEDLGE